MSIAVDWLTGVVGRALSQVLHTFIGVWPFLLISVVVAAALTTYVGGDRLAAALRANTAVAVIGAVALAAFTPFCSCGTTAIVLGAMASRVPWAPLVAFMVASPLTSPGEYVLSAGLFGMPFATTFFVAAIVLGLAAGAVTHALERTGLLAGQARVRPSSAAADLDVNPDANPDADLDAKAACCTTTAEPPAPACCDTAGGSGGGGGTSAATTVAISPAMPAASVATWRARYKVDLFAGEVVATARRLALFFFGFATIGYLVIEAVPGAWVTGHVGGDTPWAVVIAALAGIPVYLNPDGSLPMVAALMDGGMGPGPALAFLVTGAGTSIGAISGMFVIARARIVALIIGLLLGGALLLGWIAPLWL